MTKAIFNELVVSIPPGWEDGTVVTLIGPSPGTAAPMVARLAGSDRPTVALKEVKASGAPKMFADAHVSLMQNAAVDVVVAYQGEVDVGGVMAESRELCFGPTSNRARQINLFFRRGDQLFTVVGTGSDDLHFDAVRKASIAIAGSLRRTDSSRNKSA